MVPLEAGLLGGAALAFGLVVWLVHHLREHGDHELEHLADAAGWDYHPVAPQDRIARLAALAEVGDVEGGATYLAGPSTAGPFEFVSGLKGPSRSGRWTFVHVRTAVPCGGLWVGPSPRFRPSGDGLSHEAERFARRFDIRGADEACMERFLDEETRRILLRPYSSVRIGWAGNDFVVAFPLETATPRGVQTLLAYATALALRACGGTHQASLPPVITPCAGPAVSTVSS